MCAQLTSAGSDRDVGKKKKMKEWGTQAALDVYYIRNTRGRWRRRNDERNEGARGIDETRQEFQLKINMFNNLTARQKSLIETSLSRELFHFVKMDIVSLMLDTINDLFLEQFVYLNKETLFL